MSMRTTEELARAHAAMASAMPVMADFERGMRRLREVALMTTAEVEHLARQATRRSQVVTMSDGVTRRVP